MVAVRSTARALITDPRHRVLLIRVHDEVAWDASDRVTDYWITVGGGVESGESFDAAIVREIFEETGHRVDDPGPCIWRRQMTLTGADGLTRSSDERYFWCQLASAELSDAHLTASDRRVIREFRWWDLDEHALSEIRIFPEGFLPAAADVLLHGRPATPRWLRTG